MGYLFLVIALIGGTAKAYCGKKTSTLINSVSEVMALNMLRMLLCIIIGGALAIFADGGIDAFKVDAQTLLISAMSGVFSAFFVITWIFAVRSGAYTMIEVSLTLGTIIPLVVCSVLFDEQVKFLQWIGFVVLVIAVFIMSSYNKSVVGKTTVFGNFVLVAAGICNGMADLSQKLFVRLKPDGINSVFNFYSYIVSFLVILIMFLTQKEKQKSLEKTKGIAIYVIIMAVGLFVNSFFKVKAAGLIDAAKLYPLNQGAALLISAVMASVAFKEKITVKSAVGLVLAFIALCIINLV
ncbi:MAG: EamA family transporter [Clostridia bacterium]|nr:EamA family transporter [Clostridia bacterium]